jgi:2-polyprenyl-3-methyl-5-hydroxy-6-metoxy-1,4-benzoquinol methylase
VSADTTRETVSCIVCGSEIPLRRAIRFRKDGFDIARCSSCGLMFRANLPTEEELAQIYDASYFSSAVGDTGGQGYDDYLGEDALHRETAHRRLERLERYVPPGRLLDVGAAAGFFLVEAGARGWDAQGIDIAAEMVDWGREHLGVALERRTLAALDAEPGSIDAVTMWDYIEHALDPRADLAHAYELLRPGGVVALSTGDAASLVAKVSATRWHLLTPRHHNYFFTAASLRRLLGSLGFEVLYEGHPGARYSVRYLTYKLRATIDVSPMRRAADAVSRSRLGGLKVPMNLGDIVTVIARRAT